MLTFAFNGHTSNSIQSQCLPRQRHHHSFAPPQDDNRFTVLRRGLSVASTLTVVTARTCSKNNCWRRLPRSVPKSIPTIAIKAAKEPSSVPPDVARAALVAQRLTRAETALTQWGYLVEVVYTWLGLISLGVAGFATYSQGGWRVLIGTSMGLGMTSVALSVFCSLIGWFQARGCRSLGRKCGLAAASLEQGGSISSSPQLATMMPSLNAIETSLRARQRTALLGAFFAVLGLQAMVGLMVAKVLATSGGFQGSPGINLDIFTLLAVGNSALAHIIGGGAAAFQQAALPPICVSRDEPFQGWAHQ